MKGKNKEIIIAHPLDKFGMLPTYETFTNTLTDMLIYYQYLKPELNCRICRQMTTYPVIKREDTFDIVGER